MRPFFFQGLHLAECVTPLAALLFRKRLFPAGLVDFVVDLRIESWAGFEHQDAESFFGQRPCAGSSARPRTDDDCVVLGLSHSTSASARGDNRGSPWVEEVNQIPIRANWPGSRNRSRKDPISLGRK